MKTLYISDLDGTFLNNKAELSKESESIICEVINEGVNFSVATARTFATVLKLFENVSLNLPLVLMNGVMVFDPKEKKVIKSHSIDNGSLKDIFEVYKMHRVYPLVYRYINGLLEIEYYSTDNPHQMKYVGNRTEALGKKFVFSSDFNHEGKGEIIYIVTLDTYEKILPVYKDISKIDGISSVFYRDNYTDCYFLEIFAANVSKASAMLEIKDIIGADRIVAFGDNLNDIEMFKAADEAYAVTNACDELKMIATAVIGINDADSVAKFILNDHRRKI